MHPLHDYVAKQFGDKLKARHVLVVYDPRREFAAFIDEVRAGVREPVTNIALGGLPTRLIEYGGSFFQVRALAEQLFAGDEPEPILIYVPGVERDPRASVLMELELAGQHYEPQLKKLARYVLRQRYTDVDIDEMVAPERVTYEDLARAAADTGGSSPSLLKALFDGVTTTEELLAAWLTSDSRDRAIADKEATRELIKLVRAHLGLVLPEEATLAKLRSITARFVLGAEFRSDLKCAAPPSLATMSSPATKQETEAARDLARRLRTAHGDAYEPLADGVEAELGLRTAGLPAAALGSIDTFRFEERALWAYCNELVAAGKFAEALTLVAEREQSFWLIRDITRKAQWEACRRMAELGSLAHKVRAAAQSVGGAAAEWIEAYTCQDGWHRLDQAQRRLEAWVTTLDEEPDERALGIVRRLYEDTCDAMARGFTKALEDAHWSVPTTLHQTRVYPDMVETRPRPMAYVLVDAMRFEMGRELLERLPKDAEAQLRPALSALPSVTPIGMAALLPGASASFSVVEEKEVLASRIGETFLPTLKSRQTHAKARIPGLVEVTLDDLLGYPQATLRKKLGSAEVVLVRSLDIDHAGETASTRAARKVMDGVIDDLVRAVRRLAGVGIEHTVITADHGHLFFGNERDESMRTDSPGGYTLELHRRCWIGRGGHTPTGCVRVEGAALGYDTDLDFVFPVGAGVFKAGGDLEYHHGGPSLEEAIVPVLTVRLRAPAAAKKVQSGVTISQHPGTVTNRIFSVTLQFGGSLFAESMAVRVFLLAGTKQVGSAGMAVDAELDRTTGCVTVMRGKPATVALVLSDDTASTLRVVVQDPTTDAVLCQSDEIPVKVM